MIFIEIINATQFRLYGLDKSPVCVNDADGLARLRGNRRPVILFDSLRVQCKRFTRELKEKALLDKVVVAELSTYLTEDSSHYRFAHALVAGERWVSWIKKEDWQQLQTRFAAILPQIQGLSAIPLLLKLNSSTESLPELYHDETFFYVLFDNELLTLPLEQATSYINMLGLSNLPVKTLVDWQPYLVPENTAQLPNLWTEKRQAKKPPWMAWIFLFLTAMLLYSVNTYWGYHQAKQQVSAMQMAQNNLLKQVFPAARTADPYGRLIAAAKQKKQSPNLLPVVRFFSMLSDQSIAIEQLTVEAENRRIKLEAAELSAEQKKQLTTANFILKEQPTYLEVSW